MDGLMDGQCDYYMPLKVALEHKRRLQNIRVVRVTENKQEVFCPNIHVNTVYLAHSRRDIHLT